MLKVKKILFPTDYSRCADQALKHAVYLAKNYDAELHILHAIVLHSDETRVAVQRSFTTEDFHNWLAEISEHKMDDLLANLKDEKLKIEHVHKKGVAAAPAILEYAKEQDIDLVVMGTHGRRGLGHLFLGSVAEEVVRLAPCPVMTIREQEEPIPVEELNRILVPVDFSDYAKRALGYAKAVGEAYDAHLQLLHVVEQQIHPSFYAGGVDSLFAIAPDVKDKCVEQLQRLAASTEGPDLAIENYVIEGRASRDIVRFAKENHANLIVIATHGLTGIEHLLLGSITEKVVRMAPCPVFTVKAFGKTLL